MKRESGGVGEDRNIKKLTLSEVQKQTMLIFPTNKRDLETLLHVCDREGRN